MDKRIRQAKIDYSEKLNQLQITVPKGFKYSDVAGLGEQVLAAEVLEKLRHGCAPCLSGVPIVIKEQWEHEVTVDLESNQVIAGP